MLVLWQEKEAKPWSIHTRLLVIFYYWFFNYNGTWDNSADTLPEKLFREEKPWKENASAQNLIVGEFAARIRYKTS